MYGISNTDASGNVIQGDVISVESKNCMIRSETRLVTCVGLEDIIVVDTADALLVTKVGHCQSVKQVAEHLKSNERIEAEKHQVSAGGQEHTTIWQLSPASGGYSQFWVLGTSVLGTSTVPAF